MPKTVLVLLIALALTACGDGESGSGGEAPDDGGAAPAVEASVARGGMLYDKFWVVSEAPRPRTTHPLWEQRPDKASNKRTGATTWRCKECHGWDYKGVDGAYATGSHKTGFPGVLGTKLDQEAIIASLAHAHGYKDAGLTDVDLKSLAMFVTSGLLDTAEHIDEKGAFKGDAERGEALYMKGLGGNKSCLTCHGRQGLKVPKGAPPDYEEYVGKIANKNPWEFLHKVRFSHPGSKMPAAHGTRATMQDIVDVSAFSQTLPTSK